MKKTIAPLSTLTTFFDQNMVSQVGDARVMEVASFELIARQKNKSI